MTRKMRVGALLVALCGWLSSAVVAQTTIPYSFGFEDSQSAELANWHINEPLTFVAADSASRWVVGTAVKNEGKKALYISQTADGSNAEFGTGTTVVYAYRDFANLPVGSYILSFDWKCFGAANTSMSACIGIPSQLPAVSTTTTGLMTTIEQNNCKGAYGMFRQKGANTWQNTRFSFRVSNTTPTLRLMFAFEMNNVDAALPNKLGACLDNIQIASALCTPPSNVEVIATCDTTWVSWSGTSGEYVVEYRKVGDQKWRARGGLTTTSTFYEGLKEGSYDFRVRGVCGQDSSVYTYHSGVTLFCPDEHCINYVDFTDPNVHCYYGKFDDPAERAGVIDYGSDSKQSRHTVNWEQGVFDPRTGNQLPLVPAGEMATVRLGNWNDGAEAERIVYDFTVDSISSILLLKYALVLEDPPSHGEAADKFTLRILDDAGRLIDATCGQESFQADSRAVLTQGAGWHEYSLNGSNAFWKEWTTVGLDLSPYVGQQLHIEVTTYDCDWSAHYGYAYFTLGCASAKIQTLSCGTAEMEIQAPDGFSYEWRRVDPVTGYAVEPVLSTEKIFTALDSSDYQCHLTQIGKEQCSFDLYSSVVPRRPVADYTYAWAPKNCYNRVDFVNNSYIEVRYDGDSVGTRTTDPIDEYVWTIRAIDGGVWTDESSEVNPTFELPNEGGTFEVSLEAIFSTCSDARIDTLFIPSIVVVPDTLFDTICKGDPYYFGKGSHRRLIKEAGFYGDTLVSAFGCDSIQYLDLTVNPTYDLYTKDTLCYEDMTVIKEADEAQGLITRIDETNLYLQRYLQAQTGCDSIVRQHFYVQVLGNVEVSAENPDGTIDFTITMSGVTYYTWQLNDGELHRVFPVGPIATMTNMERGIYDFRFYNDGGCELDIPQSMCLNWIDRRWDDVLFVKNWQSRQPEYQDNDAVAFQWYENDLPIEGATGSYYYAPNKLHPAVYHCVVRLMDGSEQETCKMDLTQVIAAPSNVSARKYLHNGAIYVERGDATYDAFGNRIK